jgi:hypothetical protein
MSYFKDYSSSKRAVCCFIASLVIPCLLIAQTPDNQNRNDDRIENYEIGPHWDALIGGVGNTFAGSANQYMGTGGGMKIDIFYGKPDKVDFGLVMNIYANPRLREFQINSSRMQEDVLSVLMVGAGLNREMAEKKNGKLILQLEANMVLINVVASQGYNDPDYVQLTGFSPGLVMHYALGIGKGRPNLGFWMPAWANQFVNFHCAVRPLFMSNRGASGAMVEAGISWRDSQRFVLSSNRRKFYSV